MDCLRWFCRRGFEAEGRNGFRMGGVGVVVRVGCWVMHRSSECPHKDTSTGMCVLHEEGGSTDDLVSVLGRGLPTCTDLEG